MKTDVFVKRSGTEKNKSLLVISVQCVAPGWSHGMMHLDDLIVSCTWMALLCHAFKQSHGFTYLVDVMVSCSHVISCYNTIR